MRQGIGHEITSRLGEVEEISRELTANFRYLKKKKNSNGLVNQRREQVIADIFERTKPGEIAGRKVYPQSIRDLFQSVIESEARDSVDKWGNVISSYLVDTYYTTATHELLLDAFRKVEKSYADSVQFLHTARDRG